MDSTSEVNSTVINQRQNLEQGIIGKKKWRKASFLLPKNDSFLISYYAFDKITEKTRAQKTLFRRKAPLVFSSSPQPDDPKQKLPGRVTTLQTRQR